MSIELDPVSVELEPVYDWDSFERRTAPPPRRPSRGGLGAAMLAAALWAVDDVVMGEKQRTPVVEEAPSPEPDPEARVDVFLVPGDPQRSWARVRP